LEVVIPKENIFDRSIRDSDKLLVISLYSTRGYDEQIIEYFKTSNRGRFLCVYQEQDSNTGIERESFICSVKEAQAAILDCLRNFSYTKYPRLEKKLQEPESGTIAIEKKHYVDDPEEFGSDIIIELTDMWYMCIKVPDLSQFSEEFRQIINTMRKKEPLTIYF
jgi:hypothetical protein